MDKCANGSIQSQIENRKSKNGFTIVELLMVIAIISVLVTITFSAISGSMKRAREQKAIALCRLVEQGFNTYYAQDPNGEWPIEALNKENLTLNADENGDRRASDKVAYRVDDEDVQKGILKLVKKTQEGNPVMDVSGLFVTRQGGNLSQKYGMDFTSAVRGTKKNPTGIKLSQMAFGYPDKETGKFRQFTVVYSPATDKVKVSR